MISVHSSNTQVLDAGLQVSTPAKSNNDSDTAVSTSISSVQVTLSQQHSQSSALTYSPAAAEPVDSSTVDNTASSTILTFIDAQLRRDIADGASEEELSSRLQAGLEGFITGFNEAYEQLDASGFLTEDVSTAINATYDQVLEGINALAAELGISSPVPADTISESPDQIVIPNASEVDDKDSGPLNILSTLADDGLASVDRQKLNLIDALPEIFIPIADKDSDSGSALLAEERRYQFDLVTKEGDRVSINAFSHYSSSASYADGGKTLSASQGQSLGFSVDGDINDDELAAINDLLKQVNDLASDFFTGDLGAAFDRAMELNVDNEQIAQFSLELAQSRTVSVASVYRDIEKLSQEDQPVGLAKNEMISLAHAYQQTQALKLISDNISIEFNLVEQLSSFVSDLRVDTASGGKDSSAFQEFIQKMTA